MSLELNRRDFIKLSGAGTAGFILYKGVDWRKVAASSPIPLHKQIGETTTICPYCGVGCSAIMAVEDGRVTHIEGDPDHPVSEGTLCPKGQSIYRTTDNEQRLKKVLYRAPGAKDWEEKSWDWAIAQIARRIKDTRDANWVSTDSSERVVNRTEALAAIGSVFPNDEEAYLMTKIQRALGLVYIENQARLCVSTAVAANEETFGRGPMTNQWTDLANSDCIMCVGGNPAESFPIAFKWMQRAKDKGARLIHVDPRFTRTSAKCDIYANIRVA